MIRIARAPRLLPAALLAGVLAVGIMAGPAGLLAAVPTLAHGAAAGLGFWETLGCIGCIGGFVAGAGTTVAGLAVFLTAYPQIGILCVSVCVIAAS